MATKNDPQRAVFSEVGDLELDIRRDEARRAFASIMARETEFAEKSSKMAYSNEEYKAVVDERAKNTLSQEGEPSVMRAKQTVVLPSFGTGERPSYHDGPRPGDLVVALRGSDAREALFVMDNGDRIDWNDGFNEMSKLVRFVVNNCDAIRSQDRGGGYVDRLLEIGEKVDRPMVNGKKGLEPTGYVFMDPEKIKTNIMTSSSPERIVQGLEVAIQQTQSIKAVYEMASQAVARASERDQSAGKSAPRGTGRGE